MANSDMMTQPPKVSCIIPTYNCADFVGQAVESVLSQQGLPFEIIVVNDGSTDDTARVLQRYDGQIRIITQDNQGVSAARNHGVQAAQGAYIVFLDADDWLLPGKLLAQAALLDSDSSLGAVHSGWRIVDEGETAVRDQALWQNVPDLDLATWLLWKPVFLGAMMFRRDWLLQAGRFDTRLKQAEDVDVLLKLSLAGCKMAWLQAVTVCYRQHGGSTMQNGRQQAKDMMAVLDRFFSQPNLPRRVRRLEQKVRYYTLLWLVWQLDQTGYADDILPYLQRSCDYNDFPTLMQAHHWLGQLLRNTEAQGQPIAELRRFWPVFQQALGLSNAQWLPVKHSLTWWLDVWWHYLQARPASANLESYRQLSGDELVDLVQNCLVGSPQPVPPSVIERFWQDVQALGMVPLSRHYTVTSLYLTLWSQSLLGKRWKTAVSTFGKLLQVGLHPQAIRAWGKFMKTAVKYILSF